MRAILQATALIALILGIAIAANTYASPTPAASSGDLDRPLSAFDAAANETGDNNGDSNDPGDNDNDDNDVDIFGETIPGRKILFIVDRSCSMSGSGWSTLVTEMHAVLDGLAQNNATLQQQWNQNGQQGPMPKIEIAIVSYHSSAQRFQSQLIECDTAGANAAKGFLNSNGPTGATNWTDGFRKSQHYGGAFDTIYFMSDGYPNVETNGIDPESSALAALHVNHDGGTVFIAQYFSSYGGSYGRDRMQQLKTSMDAKPNIEGRFSDASTN